MLTRQEDAIKIFGIPIVIDFRAPRSWEEIPEREVQALVLLKKMQAIFEEENLTENADYTQELINTYDFDVEIED